MKVGAHPLVVAVALGLVGPQVLEEAEPSDQSEPCAGCDADLDTVDGLTAAIATQLTDADDTTLSSSTVDWTTAQAPSSDDFARVALAFEKARKRV